MCQLLLKPARRVSVSIALPVLSSALAAVLSHKIIESNIHNYQSTLHEQSEHLLLSGVTGVVACKLPQHQCCEKPDGLLFVHDVYTTPCFELLVALCSAVRRPLQRPSRQYLLHQNSKFATNSDGPSGTCAMFALHLLMLLWRVRLRAPDRPRPSVSSPTPLRRP